MLHQSVYQVEKEFEAELLWNPYKGTELANRLHRILDESVL